MIQTLLNKERILVCRPEPAASELVQVLNSVGADAAALPCIQIKKLPLDEVSKSRIMELDRYSHVVVVSQHAATIGLDWIADYWPQFPSGQQWHAIGRQTAKQLPTQELAISLPNADLTSEKLLQQEAFRNLKNQRLLILKGKNGRTMLEEQFKRRGALVDTIELYERIHPAYDDDTLRSKLVEFDPEFFIALSAETLHNLISCFDQIHYDAKAKSFILSSQRVANIAMEQGFHLTYVPENLMPIDIIRCLAKLRRTE